MKIPVGFHNDFISQTVSEQPPFVIPWLLALAVFLSSQYIIIPGPRLIRLLCRASPAICLPIDELTEKTGKNK